MATTKDTYSPTILGTLLAMLNLYGLRVTKIESPSIVFDARETESLDKDEQKFEIFRKSATVDLETMLTFSNGRKVGFNFSSSSHVFIYEHDKDFDIYEERIYYKANEMTVSDFFSDIIGKTVADFRVHSAEEDDPANFEDADFDENQDEYIIAFEMIFTDNSKLGFKCDLDFMLIYYEE